MFTANTNLYLDNECLHAPLKKNERGLAFVRTYKIELTGRCRILIKCPD